MAQLLEDREIDDWFQEEKERLATALFQALQGGEDAAAAKGRFDTAFAKLLARYDEAYRGAAMTKERRERLERPVKRFRLWREERLLALRLRWKRCKERREKAKLERQYRKLFPPKKKKL